MNGSTKILLLFIIILTQECCIAQEARAINYTQIRNLSYVKSDKKTIDENDFPIDLKGFIKHEIQRLLELEREDLKKELLREQEEYLEKKVKAIQSKCKCEKVVGPRGPPGERGLTGPPGPPGPPGKRGPIGNILRPPVPRMWLVHLEADEGETVEALCRFYGNPIANVTWSIRGNNVEIITKVEEDKSEVLSTAIIKNITWNNRGVLACYASSILGSAKKVGFIRVRKSPSIVGMPSIVYSYLGVPFKFPTCKAVSYPDSIITWTKSYGDMDMSRFHVSNGTLEVSRIEIVDEGFYICTARNSQGSDEAAVQLKTKPFSFSRRPPSYQTKQSTDSLNLTCGAYGKQLSGNWIDLYDGKILENYIIETSSNHEFLMTAIIDKSGEYQCQINNGASSITATSYVKDFSFDSRLLASNETDQLYDWIHEKRSGARVDGFKRCMELRNNFNLPPYQFTKTVYKYTCNTDRDIIMIVKDNCMNVFGGYHGKNGNNFLFDFKSNTKFERLGNATTAGCGNSFGPCFNYGLYVDIRYRQYYYRAPKVMYVISSLGKNYEKKGFSYLGCRRESKVMFMEILQEN